MNFTLEYNEFFHNYQASKPFPIPEEKKTVSEIYKDGLMNLAADYAKAYTRSGKDFINSFIKFASVKSACLSCVCEFESQIQPYEPDEKISDYVSKLKLPPKETRLLARTLKMIKIISG